MPFREFHYRWSFDLKASPEDLWPFIADTNRFNRDTGVPRIEVENDKKPLRNARRKVRQSIYGMDLEWEEQPFEWVRPVRFGIERVYSKGPMARMRALAELTPKDNGGTRVNYEIWATPRNAVGTIAIPLQLKLKIGPAVRTAFQKYDELAMAGVDASISEATSMLPETDRSRIDPLAEKLLQQSEQSTQVKLIIEKLVEFVVTADDFSVARIRPYQLADSWNLARRAVLETCLRATRVGLLDLRWDILCPMCRGASDVASLKDIPSDAHCPTCKIDFNTNFDRYVELTFKPNAAIRNVQIDEFCISGPQRTPHVVVQQLLPAAGERQLDLPLGIGNYRLRVLELPGSQLVNVADGGEQTVTVEVSPNGWKQDVLNVSTRSSFILRNRTDSEQLVILERMAWSDQAATAAEVTALQMFRDLFSSEALRPGENISVGTLTVLFTDLRHSTQLYREIGDATAFGRVMNHFDVLKTLIAECDGALVKTIGDAVMAVFRSPAGAVVAMLQAQSALANPPEGIMPLQLKAGLHTGPCIAVTLNDRLDYFGSTVNMASRLEGLSTGNDVIISRTVYEDAKVVELLKSDDFEASPFEMTLKGFEEELVELWRVRRVPKSD